MVSIVLVKLEASRELGWKRGCQKLKERREGMKPSFWRLGAGTD